MDEKTIRKMYRLAKRKLSSLKMYCLFVTTIAVILFGICIFQYNHFIDEKKELQNQYSSESKDYKLALTKIEDLSHDVDEIMNVSKELEEQNQALATANQEYYEELTEFRKNADLYNMYKFAMVDEAGNRTDITIDQLKHLENLLKEADVNDQDLILAWIMTESGGDETAKNDSSTAKGYGQFLDSTSRFVYTDLLGYSDWNPSVALNGDINLEMMVAYIDYLYNLHDHDLYDTIRAYRGKQDISNYVNKIDSYLKNKNKNVQMISTSLD